MNFLAHAFLAGILPADRAGGILGDFIKGPLIPAPAGVSEDLVQGLMLHRRIDVFAETHPAFCRSRARISAARRRVSGIMVDIFYDHFLAALWETFSDQTLESFAADTYQIVKKYGQPFPSSFSSLFDHMVAEDWLVRYREAGYISDVLDRMAQYRLRLPNPLQGAGEELQAHYAGFEADFLVFLPDAQAFVLDHIQSRT